MYTYISKRSVLLIRYLNLTTPTTYNLRFSNITTSKIHKETSTTVHTCHLDTSCQQILRSIVTSYTLSTLSRSNSDQYMLRDLLFVSYCR